MKIREALQKYNILTPDGTLRYSVDAMDIRCRETTEWVTSKDDDQVYGPRTRAKITLTFEVDSTNGHDWSPTMFWRKPVVDTKVCS